MKSSQFPLVATPNTDATREFQPLVTALSSALVRRRVRLASLGRVGVRVGVSPAWVMLVSPVPFPSMGPVCCLAYLEGAELRNRPGPLDIRVHMVGRTCWAACRTAAGARHRPCHPWESLQREPGRNRHGRSRRHRGHHLSDQCPKPCQHGWCVRRTYSIRVSTVQLAERVT